MRRVAAMLIKEKMMVKDNRITAVAAAVPKNELLKASVYR